MRHQGLLAFLAVLMCTASVFFYIFEKKIDGDYDLVKREGFLAAWKIKSDEHAAAEQADDTLESETSKPLRSTSQNESDDSPESSRGLEHQASKISSDTQVERTSDGDGVDSLLPALKAPRIRSIPWGDWEVKREFNIASTRACRLLPAGTTVSEPLSPKNVEKTMYEGRPIAFTVGLKVDPLFRGKLPIASKSTIEGYLDDHLLAIQPTVIKSSAGYSFTGEVRCAFFERGSPRRTSEPEAMIAAAVQQFRVLGIVDESKEGEEPSSRTLVMAFKFMKQENELNLVIGKPIEAFELLLIHLPKSDSDDLELQTFATAGNRKDLQRLTAIDANYPSAAPPIHANIRFEEFRFMGMYPSNPVVTGIQNRIEASVPVPDVQKRLIPADGVDTVMLSKVLDNFIN